MYRIFQLRMISLPMEEAQPHLLALQIGTQIIAPHRVTTLWPYVLHGTTAYTRAEQKTDKGDGGAVARRIGRANALPRWRRASDACRTRTLKDFLCRYPPFVNMGPPALRRDDIPSCLVSSRLATKLRQTNQPSFLVDSRSKSVTQSRLELLVCTSDVS